MKSVEIYVGGVPLTEEITFHQFDAAWKELHRLWKAAQKSHSLTEVAELNGKLIERLLQIETTLEDALFWVEDCAVEMGFSLETGENLRP